MTPNQVVSMLTDHGHAVLFASHVQVVAVEVFRDMNTGLFEEGEKTFFPDENGKFDRSKVSAWLGY